jgi:hypothetical protein
MMMTKWRRMRSAGHVACMGETRNGDPEAKRPLGRSWRSWEDNINMYLREIGL